MIQRFYYPPSVACALSDHVSRENYKKKRKKNWENETDVEYKEKLVFYIEIDTFKDLCVLFWITFFRISDILVKNIRVFQQIR